MTMRSVVHIEARHTTVPEQLALDLAGTISRTGALIHETISACIALGPEHAALFAHAGWGKDDLRRFVYEHAVNSPRGAGRGRQGRGVGQDAVAPGRATTPTRSPTAATEQGLSDPVKVLNSEQAVQIVVVGAHNSGVSAVIETFGPRGGPPFIAPVEPS